MSEKKRFYKFLDDKQEWVIRDRTNRRQEYRVGRNKRYTEKLVDLLNDQQPIINKLKEENEQLKQEHKIAIDEMITDYKNLEKENNELKENKRILDSIKKRHNCLNCVKTIENYCLKHYKKISEDEICENYRYWR